MSGQMWYLIYRCMIFAFSSLLFYLSLSKFRFHFKKKAKVIISNSASTNLILFPSVFNQKRFNVLKTIAFFHRDVEGSFLCNSIKGTACATVSNAIDL